MSQIIQVRMNEETIEQVNNLQAKVHAPSRSDAIRRAVGLSDMLINAVKQGDRILIEDKKGKQRQILITGLTK